MDTLQKIRELHKQVKELEERKQATDSKSEDKKLRDAIRELKEDMGSLASDLVENLIPEPMNLTIKVEKKIKMETDYYDFESVSYDIVDHPELYTNEEDVRKAMLNTFRDGIDIYDLIDSEDVKIEYD